VNRLALSFLFFVTAFSLSPALNAQPLSTDARLQGYVHWGDTTLFVFDADVYGVDPEERVVVTGAFRGWSPRMDAARWTMERRADDPQVWTLEVHNPNYSVIPPGTPFKYRIDEGAWMPPPIDASNAEGGNLVFLYGIAPARLQAELRDGRTIWAFVTGEDVEAPLATSAYRLVDADGHVIPIARVLPNTATRMLVVPGRDLDPRRVYFLEIPEMGLRALCRFDNWFRTLYSDKPLGAVIREDGSETVFRVFAPRANRVRLFLYEEADDTPAAAREVIGMRRDTVGVWETVVEGDLHGMYYDFTVHGPHDPGNYFYGTHPVHVSDPYARVNVEAWGKSRVWRPTTPATPLPDGRPPMEDVIAYEVHVQDFTDRLPVDDALKGTLPAMVEPGLRNSRGEPVGFDYLLDLGVNVVHLMPVQEYLHYPDDMWREHFADDPYMQEQGIAEENYQWGYRTTHAFAVETRFRAGGTEHGAQREQFRDLVQAFHDHGIAVIIDLVPNHTGENMDGSHHLLNFNVFDKQYYYRTDERLQHIGPFGNEIKTEDRPMVQRWLLDQCQHWIDEFGIDGFRIDLAGQIDEQTLRKLRQNLGEDIIIYGEPWIAPSDPDVVDNPDWSWYKEDAPITYFQDEARNAFKGPTDYPHDKATDRGYAGGHAALRDQVIQALNNRFQHEHRPTQGINYLDIHDNWALADRFAVEDWDGRRGVHEDRFRVAAGLLFTSLGPIVLHGGTEMMRSKGAAGNEELVKSFPLGTLYFHGKRDTYNLRRANQFVWENLGQQPGVDGAPNDYATMVDYWKGLIAFRRSDVGEVFRTAEQPPNGYYRWILPDDTHQLGYLVADRVLVLTNVADEARTFHDVYLPMGNWRLISNGTVVNHVDGVEGEDALLYGDRSHVLTVPGATMKIWVRE
jgi:pullulanase/glycogen debranching enzyme